MCLFVGCTTVCQREVIYVQPQSKLGRICVQRCEQSKQIFEQFRRAHFLAQCDKQSYYDSEKNYQSCYRLCGGDIKIERRCGMHHFLKNWRK